MRVTDTSVRSLLLVLALLPVTALAQAPTSPLAAPDQFFDSNGVRIRYVEQGQGAPVVLIHGYTGNLDRHFIGNGVFAELSRDHRVIVLDCRGHGKGGKPSDPGAYGPEMGQDVVRLLDHLQIPRAHIIGYSMGAMIAGQLLTTNPDRFLTATLVGHHALHSWTAADTQAAEEAARELEGQSIMPALTVVVVDGAEHGGERGVMRRPEFMATLRPFLAGSRRE